MGNELFRRELAAYAAVHRDWRNKATHFVGIPVIVLSLLLALSQGRVEMGGTGVSLALLVTAAAVLGWMALDLGIGLIMAAIMAVAWYTAEVIAGSLGPTSTWMAFGVLFVGGWILQFLGHYFEGRRPALLSNIFQAFVGPMFLVAETMVALGYRADLAAMMGEGEVHT